MINLPLLRSADVLVLGGSTAAVEAARAIRAVGRSVFLVTPYTYLGDDICAPMRYWPSAQAPPQTPLAHAIFGENPPTEPLVSPMRVKHVCEQALLREGIDFLFGTYPVAPLRDEAGRLAGAVIANRSGFQAVRAGALIDATERALLGRRLREAAFADWPAGFTPVRRVVVGETPDASYGGRPLPGFFEAEGKRLMAFEWCREVELPDASPASVARVDVELRLRSWYPGQLLSSDRLGVSWPDRLQGTGHRQSEWQGVEAFPLEAIRLGEDAAYLLSPLGDVTDGVAGKLQQPCVAMELGRRLGRRVAEEATGPAGQVEVDYSGENRIEGVEVCRRDRYFRLQGATTVAFDLNRLPELGQCDVLIAGGGTGGAPAGIAAARTGARAVVVEFTSSLGGVGTEGRIATYWHGNRVGFTAEVDHGLQELGPAPEFSIEEGKWNTEWKKHWYLREAHAAGAQVWFGAMVVAVAMRGNAAAGAVVATPYDLGLVRAAALVDSTGNGDLAAAAGAETVNISKAHVAVQGSGLAPINPQRHYANTDFTFIDDTDVLDVTRAFAVARQKFRDWFDLAQLVDTRQRQQIRGEFSLDPVDFLAERDYPDTITTAQSNFDSHGFTIHPLFMAKAPDEQPIRAHVPYRCLLPRGVEGILVTGLGMSAHRDALPVVRMQADVQNQGYAAGRAAAMAAAEGLPLRDVDLAALQRHLVSVGVLAPEAAGRSDSFPLGREIVEAAVREGTDDYRGLAVIFSNPEASRPLLREAYADASAPERRLRLAYLLGLMGDGAGLATLTEELDRRDWDEGWHYTGMGQFGFSLSPVDGLLVALGRIGAAAALPTMLRKLESLGLGQAFSHYRALVLAFEAMPTKQAAPAFEAMLDDVSGQTRGEMAAMVRESPASEVDTSERNRQLKELLLARGLLACGDPHGKARAVLEAYRRDLHGHYARHAHALLGGDGADGQAPTG